MSPELDTLDQLCGDDMPVTVIRQLFDSDDHFRRAILAMLHEREVLLLGPDGFEVPHWERRPLLSDATRWVDHRLSITASGARRIT